MPQLVMDWYLISRRSAFIFITSILLLVGGGTITYIYLTKPATDNVAAMGEQQIAHFMSLEGTVKVKRARASYFITVNRATLLETGDTVQTDIDASAQIQFGDGSTYDLAPDSTMVIRLHTLSADKTSTVNVAVGTGDVRVHTSERGDSVNQVVTRSASSNFEKSSEGTVSVTRDGGTNINVSQGAAQVTTQDGQKTRVETEEHLEVASTGAVLRHEKLMPTPRLGDPQNLSQLQLPEGKGVVTLGWQPVDTATRYHVAVSTSRYFTQIVTESIDVHQPQFLVERLPAGRYFWQVRAFDNGGHSSNFSDPFQFTIVDRNGSVPRGLEIVLSEVNRFTSTLFEVKGKTVAGSQVKINGQPAEVDGDGRFRKVVKVTGSELVIEADDQSGNHGRVVRKI